ncbi:hypothetical protein BDP55DRAFT_627262 [Colletotrichum godetiae]|uniref:Uncharacterized protein n=1 Tax=Colletotrichum godetiae TaxID=1209918 RepID=A0AAJ0F1F3_9PEZI|nr:uncharacterized protein BDP55DRAFT_627262 [Colletotrichum godetiae]KAK1691631.1 hypothetical protein BDP55DRAFT_627262 [Colletotrichum godetiae]
MHYFKHPLPPALLDLWAQASAAAHPVSREKELKASDANNLKLYLQPFPLQFREFIKAFMSTEVYTVTPSRDLVNLMQITETGRERRCGEIASHHRVAQESTKYLAAGEWLAENRG